MSASRPIDPGTYQRLRELFLAAIELPKDEQRRVIDERCEDDQLRARLEAMLRLDATRKLEVDGERSFDEVANIADLATDDLGPYRILEPLGEGGFCVVFLAEQIAPVRRNVALKLIKPGMDTRSVLARFEAERQALALMSHPAIAKVYDSGVSAKGRAFFAMEHVPGEPITTYCDRRGLTIRERLLLFIRVCEAVQHAHQKAIIHRDLKPSNILVADVDGKAMPKVIDFGIAKSLGQSLTERTLHTREGQFIGTPAYMSPEQAESSAADVDTRADIYSLGIILYELLVGCRPFDARSFGSSDLVALKRILSEHPPRPSARLASLDDEARRRYARLRQRDPRGLARELRGDLDWITLRAIAKSRGDRYGTPTELAQDIERHLRHEPVSASPPTLAYRVRKLCARHRVIVAAAAMMIATLGIAFAVSFVLWLRTKDALERSEGLRLTALSTATVGENPDVALLLALEGHERYRGIESRNAVIAALLELVPHRVQRGHESLVVAVATHPEGDLVASSSEDGQVLLWSSRTLERKGELAPPGGGKSWIRLAFDGSGAKLRGAASDGSAAEWRVSTNERVASLEPLSSRVAWIGWALDPARVNVVTEDGLFLSRSIEGGHVLHRVETGVRDVTAAALAPDAESLALGTRTGE
ncbi:MAG TPA: serine/threonine-protein kinase, partial [Planctomycetota bacterium]|nr:serine/threonine-protein kinase [Planctomycetota bacterium]